MVSIRRISLVVSLLAISSIVAYLVWYTPPLPGGNYPLEKTVKYSITVKNPTNQLIKDSTFWLTAPLGVGVYQVLEELTITYPYRMETDGSGNQKLHFTIDLLPPYGVKTFKVTAQLKLSPEPNTISEINSQAFLGEEAFIEVNEPKIQQLARQLAAESDLDTVRNIYRWVTTNIKKTGYIKREKGALQTLLSETGDCTDTMYLFSALSRANGIPTRNMAGFTAMENAVLRPHDYHNWIEVFVGGKWQLVDPDKEVFMDKSEDYIAMTLLKDGSSTELQLSQRLFGGPEYLKITMN